MRDFIKKGKEINIKKDINLPKDLPWQVFQALITDLGATPETHPSVFFAVKQKDTTRLMDLMSHFGPRCILERSGNQKADAFTFFVDYQIGAFLKKYPFTGLDTKAAATKKFFEAEKQCKLFNEENHAALTALSERHPDYLGVVDEIREDVVTVLGNYPNLNSIQSFAMHGPGVSLGDGYQDGKSTDFFKWASLPYTVTPSTRAIALDTIYSDARWIGALDDWYRRKFRIPVTQPINVDHFHDQIIEVVDGSKITFVPKTALTDRTIAIEPLLAVFLQLGVDRVIRRALVRQWGYDLNTQEVNQNLAEEGSIDDDLVTVDLSSASDTISLKICEMFLPAAWYNLLLDLRSPVGDLEGKEVPFEKISSMGNGYTFALESLIFGALARCAIRRTGSIRKSAVYGDDIIVPKTAYVYLLDLLNLSGFSVNKEKSFSEGPFRESCGRDFFLGYDVRPVFLTKRVTTLSDLFYLHNAVWQLQERMHWTWELDFSATLALIRKWIPNYYRNQFFGPPTDSLDTYLFSERKLRRNKWHQQTYWAVEPRPIKYNKLASHCDSFFFRKLMSRLKARGEPPQYIWDKRKRMTTGNAFDVTKRDSVYFICARRCVP